MNRWNGNNIQNIYQKAIKFIKPIYNQQSVIFAWLFSYAAVLFLPILISSIIYIRTARVLEDEIINSNFFLLKRVEQHMDGLIKDAVRLSQEIALNPRINELLKVTKASPYDIYLTVKDLKTYTIPNTSIDDFYIYFKNLDLILSSYSSSNNTSFFEAFLKKTGVSYQQWYKLISDYHKGDFIPIQSFNNQSQPRRMILFVRTIPLLYQNGFTANIVISLDESRFVEDAKDIQELNSGTLLVLDENNQTIGSSRSVLNNQTVSYNQLNLDNGMFRTKIDGEKVVISYITSQLTQWKYITIIPNRIFWKKAEYVRNLTYLSLICCLLIGGFITLYALRKNYNPVVKLIKLLEKHLGLDYDKTNNEYQFIEQGIDKVHTDLERIDAILIQQNTVLKSHFLLRLIKGNLETDFDISERLALYGIRFKSDFFAVMAFYITDFEATGLPGQTDALTDFKQIQLKMITTIETLVDEKNQGLMFDNDDLLICLVNFDQNGVKNGKKELTRIATAAQEYLRKDLKIDFVVSVSAIHQTLAGIPEAYHEALQAMEYKKLLGIKEIIHFEDFNELPKGSYYYPLEQEYQLINCIMTGDFTKSKTILNSIFEKNFENNFLPVKIARCLMFNLTSTMIKAINEVNNSEADFWEKLCPVEKLLECENINEMKQEIVEILKVFCSYLALRNNEKKKHKSLGTDSQFAAKIKAFVEQNYQDININIATIAENFKIHPVTLSKIFNQQTGEGLLDYINRIRIRRAEELFKEKVKNLEEVSKAVGYYSVRTFTRAFKKYAGVTPGKYKESNN